MIRISNLEGVPIETIVHCLTQSFSEYVVRLPAEVDYWDRRLSASGLDKSLSWGVFDEEKLVGFVLNAIGDEAGEKTAFNTGTGILKAYRGQQWVDKMYAFGIPKLKQNGIYKCALEVIDSNDRAIRVYERIGFGIRRKLWCYSGQVKPGAKAFVKKKKLERSWVAPYDSHYGWDNRSEAILRPHYPYEAFEVMNADQQMVGHFIINPQNGNLAQLETIEGQWGILFSGIAQISENIKINNVYDRRRSLIDYLAQSGITNTINQYEMEWVLRADS
jgi:ribosomal protein S18 acetylase RimI-like enzyme